MTYTPGRAEQIGGDRFSLDFPTVAQCPRYPTATDERHRLVTTAIVGMPWDVYLSTLITLGSGTPCSLDDQSRGSGVNERRFLRNGAYPERFDVVIPNAWAYRSVDLRAEKQFAGGTQRVSIAFECVNICSFDNFSEYEGYRPPEPATNPNVRTAAQPARAGPPPAGRITLWVLITHPDVAAGTGSTRRAPTWTAIAFAAVAVCLPPGRGDTPAAAQGRSDAPASAAARDAFLEDLSRRSFTFFWEQTDPATGIVRDRSRSDGSPSSDNHVKVGSIASVGFGLTGMCIAAERGWLPPEAIRERTRTTLRTFAERLEHKHGWFYHWLNVHTGAREWQSEVSSIDTALLLGGVLSVRQCFAGDPEIARLATAIYHRVDFVWMRNGHPTLLSHGWRPESGMIVHRWDAFSEASMLYLLGIGSPTHPLPAASWRAWVRPMLTWDGMTYVTHAGPLFLHQYSHAWVDFRRWRDRDAPHDWFGNSVTATRANQRYCLSLRDRFPGYGETLWGVTASDARTGYKAWGGPPHDPQVDGTVVPCAAAGSLMFAPDLTLPALRHMRDRYGDRLYGRYGFADAFHPTADWINPDVIGIDLGITLLSAENARTGNVWRWFMANPEIAAAMRTAGFTPVEAGSRPQPTAASAASPAPARYELIEAPAAAAVASARAALEALPAALVDRFQARTFTAPDGTAIAYRLLPPSTPPAAGSRAPLVLLLHGSGEIGADNRRQLTPFALAWATDAARGRDRAYVVVPQMPARSATYSGPATGDARTSDGTALVPAALALVDELAATLPIDRTRLAVAGFSMGASTAWNLLHARPGFFARAMPIAGVPRADQAASVHPSTRVWAIHGNRDETNPIRHGRRAFVPLADAGARLRFSEIDHLQHEVPPVWLADGTLAAFLLGRD